MGNAKRVAKRIAAGAMKRWLEDLSEEMGLDGAITDRVIAEGQRRLGESPTEPLRPTRAPIESDMKPAGQLLKELPSIDFGGKSVKPKGWVTEDGNLMLSAEEGDGLLDFYGEFRGGYPYIHPELVAWAEAQGGFFDWNDPGSVTLYEA